MNYRVSTLAALGALILSGTAQADINPASAPEMVEMGAGAAFLGGNRPMELLIRLDVLNSRMETSNSRYVVVRMNSDFTSGASGVSYIDLQMDLAGSETVSSGTSHGFTTVSLDVQRNIEINDAYSVRLGLAGYRATIGNENDPTNPYFFKLAVDALGFAVTQRISDNQSFSGLGSNLSAEAGFRPLERLRITLGEKLGFNAGAGRPSTWNGYACGQIAPHATLCGNQYGSPGFDRMVVTSSTFLNATYQLTETLSLFGQANYNFYSINDNSRFIEGSFNGAFQYFMGLRKTW